MTKDNLGHGTVSDTTAGRKRGGRDMEVDVLTMYEQVSGFVSGLSDEELRIAIWRSMETILELSVSPLVWELGLAEAERRRIAI